jgi:hypothetical protein
MEFERKNASSSSADNLEELPEVRMGNLILGLVSGIEIHAQRTKQNMHMLEIFDLVPRRDKLFGQITGIKGPQNFNL